MPRRNGAGKHTFLYSDCWESSFGKYKRGLCHSCRITFQNLTNCPNCKGRLEMIPYEARVPRKNASKAKWKGFYKRFFPRSFSILKDL